jgi:hypothetical protein
MLRRFSWAAAVLTLTLVGGCKGKSDSTGTGPNTSEAAPSAKESGGNPEGDKTPPSKNKKQPAEAKAGSTHTTNKTVVNIKQPEAAQ